ncbi:MAG: hypothetical protein KIT25_10065 [Enhydrobacter sp.]|nr:MAG: hypothetical protein KIT25_10065 [Enhydrobacter sp.]
MSGTEEFSIAEYVRLVGELRRRDYEVVDFLSATPECRHLLLRHDIDMCLQRAVRLAEAEAEMEVTASYFVLLNTEMYNVASTAGRAALRRLLELGHDVGLHFDGAHIRDHDLGALTREVDLECAMLEMQTGRAVRVVTFHRPARWLLGHQATLSGRIHAYQPRYFESMGYCSDSAGAFRYHHPLNHPAVLEGRALQLLTHPIWWVTEPGEDTLSKLDRFRRERDDQIGRELAANCRPYAEARPAEASSVSISAKRP